MTDQEVQEHTPHPPAPEESVQLESGSGSAADLRAARDPLWIRFVIYGIPSAVVLGMMAFGVLVLMMFDEARQVRRRAGWVVDSSETVLSQVRDLEIPGWAVALLVMLGMTGLLLRQEVRSFLMDMLLTLSGRREKRNRRRSLPVERAEGMPGMLMSVRREAVKEVLASQQNTPSMIAVRRGASIGDVMLPGPDAARLAAGRPPVSIAPTASQPVLVGLRRAAAEQALYPAFGGSSSSEARWDGSADDLRTSLESSEQPGLSGQGLIGHGAGSDGLVGLGMAGHAMGGYEGGPGVESHEGAAGHGHGSRGSISYVQRSMAMKVVASQARRRGGFDPALHAALPQIASPAVQPVLVGLRRAAAQQVWADRAAMQAELEAAARQASQVVGSSDLMAEDTLDGEARAIAPDLTSEDSLEWEARAVAPDLTSEDSLEWEARALAPDLTSEDSLEWEARALAPDLTSEDSLEWEARAVAPDLMAEDTLDVPLPDPEIEEPDPAEDAVRTPPSAPAPDLFLMPERIDEAGLELGRSLAQELFPGSIFVASEPELAGPPPAPTAFPASVQTSTRPSPETLTASSVPPSVASPAVLSAPLSVPLSAHPPVPPSEVALPAQLAAQPAPRTAGRMSLTVVATTQAAPRQAPGRLEPTRVSFRPAARSLRIPRKLLPTAVVVGVAAAAIVTLPRLASHRTDASVALEPVSISPSALTPDQSALRRSIALEGARSFEPLRRTPASHVAPGWLGTVFDRNGIPLATNDVTAVEAHRVELEALNSSLARACQKPDRRCFPLGRATYDMLAMAGQTWSDQSLTVDARLQLEVTRILERRLRNSGLAEGAAVVLRPSTGEVLALTSIPGSSDFDRAVKGMSGRASSSENLAAFGLKPPGSTFKLVTAMAALRKFPGTVNSLYRCKPLGDGRVGAYLKEVDRTIRDDELDRSAHGLVNLEAGLRVSCNAFFAQLAVDTVKSDALIETAGLFGIQPARPNTPAELDKTLEQAAFGQGEVLATPLQMAMVAGTVANHGVLVRPTVNLDAARQHSPTNRLQVVTPEQADLLARGMRGVVLSGTAHEALNRRSLPPIAGKTGTAEVEDNPSHAWFIGYAPYLEPGVGAELDPSQQIAVAVLLPNAGYGGRYAAPVAGDIVRAAQKLGIIPRPGLDARAVSMATFAQPLDSRALRP